MAGDAADRRWMRMALGLARRGLGRVAPNPAVAALVVRDGRLIGRGVTAPGGRPHAEAVALRRVEAALGNAAARGATVYVTLEPCAHHGLTPPCAEALIQAGVSRVVCPHSDPDPRVSGRGFARLEEAGVTLVTGVLEREAREMNAGFLSRIERGRPHVTLKLAATLDGRIATASGESRWITGPEARRRVHLMRMRSDAVMIGAGTARVDDPMLDVRDFGSGVAQPVRVVLDSHLDLPRDGRLAKTAESQPLWLLHAGDAEMERMTILSAMGARLIPVKPDADGRPEIAAALNALAENGITRLLCEGGAGLAAALLGAGLVDELHLFTAGKAIGADGVAAVGALGLTELAAAPALGLARIERIGADTLSVWKT